MQVPLLTLPNWGAEYLFDRVLMIEAVGEGYVYGNVLLTALMLLRKDK